MKPRAAAKGRRPFLLAAVCLLFLVVATPTAEASRSLPATLAPTLDAPPTPDHVLDAELSDPPERLRLFDDLRLPERPLELVEASKTASGVFTLGLQSNIWQAGGLGQNRGGPSFQGLWTDPVTGIAYARNRWYDARTASWLSEDPLGAVDSPNLYAFVAWQPNMYTDPSGEIALIDNAIGGLASVGIGFGVSKICESMADTPEEKEQCRYTWADAGVDFALGAATSGLSSISKLKNLSRAGRLALRGGAEITTDVGLEAVRHEIKGEDYGVGDLVVGGVRNFAVGEAGAVVGRQVSRRLRQLGGAPRVRVASTGDGINPALQERLTAYKAWKGRAGIEGAPTSAQFRRFMGAHRPGSRGSTLYASRSRFRSSSAGVRNPWGRRGSPAHRARIAEAEGRLAGTGWERFSGGSLPEVRFGVRYSDLVMIQGGRRIGIQVGRVTARGVPVSRELDALADLRGTGMFDHVFFLKY